MNAIHRLAAGALFAACALAAHAELADRTRRIEVTATDAHADHRRQTADFSGDVVVSQGTLEIRADRVQMQAGPDGERRGVAFGKAGAPVRFRQRGDRPGEWNEGEADRVEYDSVANEVRLIGAASLRSLSGTTVTQSFAGDTIAYDTARDTAWSIDADRRALLPATATPARRVTIVFAPHVTHDDRAAGPAAEAALTPR